MSKAIEQLSEMPPAKRFGLLGVLALAIAFVTAAERDLQRRPGDEVRGSKWIWRVVCLNAIGSAIYFKWGRLLTQDQVAAAPPAAKGR